MSVKELKPADAGRFGASVVPNQINTRAVLGRRSPYQSSVRSVSYSPEEVGPGARFFEGDVNYVLVPRYDVRATADAGAALDEGEQIVDFPAFRKDSVRGQMKLQPNLLVLVETAGDSMITASSGGDLTSSENHHGASAAGRCLLLEVRMAYLDV